MLAGVAQTQLNAGNKGGPGGQARSGWKNDRNGGAGGKGWHAKGGDASKPRPHQQQQQAKPQQKQEDLSKLHPSWAAKRKQQQALQTTNFQGKKIKFDDDE